MVDGVAGVDQRIGGEALRGLSGDIDEGCLWRKAIGPPQIVVRRNPVIAATGDVDCAEVAHAAEAVRVDDGYAADRWIGDTRLWDLEEHAAKRVVDLLVVLVLPLGKTPKDRSKPEICQEIRGAERGGEWDLERDLIAVRRHDDPAGSEGRQLRIRVGAGANSRVKFAVDHAVRAITHDCEFVRESWIHGRVITAIWPESASQPGEGLCVRDVLHRRAADAARDLETLLRG